MTARPKIVLGFGNLNTPQDIIIDARHRVFWKGGEFRPASPQRALHWFRFASLLLVRAPEVASHDELIDHCWGDDPEGGPMNPKISFSVHLCKSYDFYTWLGGGVDRRWGFGYFFKFGANHIYRNSAKTGEAA